MLIEDLKNKTTRECQKKINTYLVSFEENLQSLIDLSSITEMKNEIKLRSIGSKILRELENMK